MFLFKSFLRAVVKFYLTLIAFTTPNTTLLYILKHQIENVDRKQQGDNAIGWASRTGPAGRGYIEKMHQIRNSSFLPAATAGLR